MTFSGWYPNSYVRMPFSGIENNYVIWPWHVGDLYYELSGVEGVIGFNPLNGYTSFTARVSGIETGYLNKSGGSLYGPLSFSQGGYIGAGLTYPYNSVLGISATGINNEYKQLSGISGVFVWNTPGMILISGIVPAAVNSFTGGVITSAITPTNSGTLSLGTQSAPFGTGYFNQYATSLVSGVGATTTIDWNLGTSQILNFNGVASGSYTVTLSNGVPGSAYVLETIQNASGTASLRWSSNIVWQAGLSGIATNSASAKDLFSFWYDGSKYLGSYSNNFF